MFVQLLYSEKCLREQKRLKKGMGRRERERMEERERKCERGMNISFLITLHLPYILHFLEFLTRSHRFTISCLANAVTVAHVSWSTCKKFVSEC